MYKDYRYINAGTNEYYRWGGKAQQKLASYLEPNANGYISVPADGGKYWTFGTSEGKFGEFAKYNDTFLSVNKGGYIYAKVGTDKATALVDMIKSLLEEMKNHFSETDLENEEE